MQQSAVKNKIRLGDHLCENQLLRVLTGTSSSSFVHILYLIIFFSQLTWYLRQERTPEKLSLM